MYPLNRFPTVDSWIETSAVFIDYAINQVLPKSKFAIRKVAKARTRHAQLLGGRGLLLHSKWDHLDTRRGCAACPYECARLQIFLAGEVHPLLMQQSGKFFHVTLADKRWRVVPKAATGTVFKRVKRKVRRAMQTLREKGLNPVFVVQYEMSGDRSLHTDYLFEPHAHILVGGVTKSDLRSAFKVRLPRALRNRDKPVRIRRVRRPRLGTILGYLAKMKAQDRVEYRQSNGRFNRYPNRMQTDHEIEWLRCMAELPISQMIQFGGFPASLTWRFEHYEMATLLGETS